MKGLFYILKGNFLTKDDSSKNWRFIIFSSSLAIIMIASSHNTEQKVFHIAVINEDVKELKSRFLDTRSSIQRLKLKSIMAGNTERLGLIAYPEPPVVIKVVPKSQDHE